MKARRTAAPVMKPKLPAVIIAPGVVRGKIKDLPAQQVFAGRSKPRGYNH